MTVYLIYAVFPTPLHKLFVEQGLLPHVRKPNYDPDEDTWISVYAWSTDKKMTKEFMHRHKSKYFRVIKKNSTDALYDSRRQKEKVEWDRIRLQPISLKYGVDIAKGKSIGTFKTVPIVMTRFEQVSIDDFDMFSDFMISCDKKNLELPDFRIFKKKYRKALEILYYTTFYTMYIGDKTKSDDEVIIEREVACDGSNYGLTYPSGYSVYIDDNELGIYLKLFGQILSIG